VFIVLPGFTGAQRRRKLEGSLFFFFFFHQSGQSPERPSFVMPMRERRDLFPFPFPGRVQHETAPRRSPAAIFPLFFPFPPLHDTFPPRSLATKNAPDGGRVTFSKSRRLAYGFFLSCSARRQVQRTPQSLLLAHPSFPLFFFYSLLARRAAFIQRERYYAAKDQLA